MTLTLVVGNANYSSWSMRPWVAMHKLGLDFRTHRISLHPEVFPTAIQDWSPTGKVPVLHDDGRVIWDSLAILEYLVGQYPDAGLLPDDAYARAIARAASAEMHSGFGELRNLMPMNGRARGRRVAMTPALAADIERIQVLWGDCRGRFGGDGPWLFGRFSLADAMFAPVVSRFVTYGVALDETATGYVSTWAQEPAYQAWEALGREEAETLPVAEAGTGD